MIALSKRNVIIGGSIGLCLLGAGFLVYTNRQKALYSQIWDKVGAVDDIKDGAFGDFRDVYACPCWNPSYLNQAGTSNTTLDYATARDYAQKIYDAHAKGLISNNQDAVVSIFNKFQNRSDIAKVSQLFSDMKFGSLKDYLKSFMEGTVTRKNYMQDIFDIISKLPK